MKYFLVLFFLLPIYLNAQSITVYGLVKTRDEQPVSFASLFMNNKYVAMSDENGFYSFSCQYVDSIKLAVKSLGYSKKEKIVKIGTLKKKYKIDFKLELRPVKLNEVQIEAKAISLFEKEDWNILDFLIEKDIIIVLARDIPNLYLYFFDINGKLLSREHLNSDYTRLFKSCSGGYHLIGEKYNLEFTYNDKKLKIIKKYTRKQFDDFLLPCVLKYHSNFIFKEFTQFNKRIRYFYYDKNKERKIIYEVFDKESAEYAQKDYFDIINLYYKTIDESNDIESKKYYTNVIGDKDWNGDLDDLAITSDLMFKIMWFKNISLKEANAKIVEIDNKLYVLDFVDKKIVKVNINGRNEIIADILIRKCKSPQIVTDMVDNKKYLICNNKDVFELNKENNKISLTKLYKIKSYFRFPRKIKIYNNEIFFLKYDNIKTTYNKIVKLKF